MASSIGKAEAPPSSIIPSTSTRTTTTTTTTSKDSPKKQQKIIRVQRLSHVRYEVPDLDKAASFLEDFGLRPVVREADRIYFSGFGIDPYIYVAEQSPTGRRAFLGAAWVTSSWEDLVTAALHETASKLSLNDGPGGGTKVTIQDPNGYPVTFIHGQPDRVSGRFDHPKPPETLGVAGATQAINTAKTKKREGFFHRFSTGPSPVHKLGHYGYVVPAGKFKDTLAWYTGLMNLKPSDSVYDKATGEDKTCFMHIDAGDTFTDHHSFFLAAGPDDVQTHIHHASFEVNDMDTQYLGHHWLQNKGWTNCWGVGRHVLGSQIFDYWFDPFGNILEHYSDGDLVNRKTPAGREAETPNSLYIWGPNIPLAFVTGKMEDAGKPAPPPPEPVKVVPEVEEEKEAVKKPTRGRFF